MSEPEPLLPQRGNYKVLRSFQKAEVVYDVTFRFCHRFLERGLHFQQLSHGFRLSQRPGGIRRQKLCLQVSYRKRER